jgi:hypothetical protein
MCTICADCTVMYCTVLHCTALYCTVLYSICKTERQHDTRHFLKSDVAAISRHRELSGEDFPSGSGEKRKAQPVFFFDGAQAFILAGYPLDCSRDRAAFVS